MSSQAFHGQAFPDYGSPYSQYETALHPGGLQASKGSSAGARRAVNVAGICRCVFLPWLLYSVLFAFMCFNVRYIHPEATKAVGWLCFFIVLGMGGAALQTRRRAKVMDEGDKGNFQWQAFGCVLLFAAFVGALVCGDFNYWTNLQPYYDVLNLQYYASVDPSKYWGQQLMDAGRISFAEASGLDLQMSMGFRDDDWYCVVPITSKGGNATDSTTYDFWAVGTNCCSGPSTEFRCGEYNNPSARSGLRLMHDEQRPFFRLAVRQAEAAFNIKSVHPLFFYWMEDPLLELNSYRDEGVRCYVLGVFGLFAVNLFCTAAAVVVFSKMA